MSPFDFKHQAVNFALIPSRLHLVDPTHDRRLCESENKGTFLHAAESGPVPVSDIQIARDMEAGRSSRSSPSTRSRGGRNFSQSAPAAPLS